MIVDVIIHTAYTPHGEKVNIFCKFSANYTLDIPASQICVITVISKLLVIYLSKLPIV